MKPKYLSNQNLCFKQKSQIEEFIYFLGLNLSTKFELKEVPFEISKPIENQPNYKEKKEKKS